MKILFCWIGFNDIRASHKEEKAGLGPIGNAVTERSYDTLVLISDLPDTETSDYLSWIKTKTSAKILLYKESLPSPTDFEAIYKAAVKVISDIQSQFSIPLSMTFHLSPGTPAMAAVWIIISKTRFPGTELIESSREQGVKTVAIPFELSAEFIPDLLRPADKRLERLSEGLPPETPEFSEIIHQSRTMQRIIAKARHVAMRSVPVLIEGESGTGKELFARAIHYSSPRKEKPFITVNCGAIPSELVESHLFGHIKGAFTGADKTQKGYFEEADKGTLFLDEVGELPLLTQVKLLRALQEKEIMPVGRANSIKIDVRIIAATNRNLIEEIGKGNFRADLFYRLAVALLKIPPLRERTGDLSLLVDYLMEKVNEESREEPGYKNKKISPDAKSLVLQHPWPGNVRELLNTIRRAAIWSMDLTITREEIEDALIQLGPSSVTDILNRPVGGAFNITEVMSTVAKHYIEKALKEANGKKSKAAKLIGLPTYQTLGNWMKKYNVE